MKKIDIAVAIIAMVIPLRMAKPINNEKLAHFKTEGKTKNPKNKTTSPEQKSFGTYKQKNVNAISLVEHISITNSSWFGGNPLFF